MRRVSLLAVLLAALVGIAVSMSAVVVTAQVPEVAVKYVEGAIPLDPNSPTWADVQGVDVQLASQALVYPVAPTAESRTLLVRALHNGTHVAFYLEWSDDTRDVAAPGVLDTFPDAVAIQFPTRLGQLPYICMGMVDNPVNIIYWKAGVGAENLVAGAGYGLSPEQRDALGLARSPVSPVELLPPNAQVVTAVATYAQGTWRVVMVRPTASVHPLMAQLVPGQPISTAFAVWDGSKGERGGLKATSGWISFVLEAAAVPTPETRPVTETVPGPAKVVEVTPTWAWAAIGVLIAVIALLLGLLLGRRQT